MPTPAPSWSVPDGGRQLLGGSLRLAALFAEVANTLTTTGLDRQLYVYATVEAAITSAAAV
jgi:hypothetical protein